MRVDQEKRPLPTDVMRAKIEDVREAAASGVVVNLAEGLVDTLSHEAPEFVPGAKNRYTSFRKSKGKNGRKNIPIAVSCHQTQADIVGLAETLYPLLSSEYEAYFHGEWKEDHALLEGFVVPIASSISSGHQGKVLQMGVETLQERCKELGLETIDTTRPEDVARYGSKPNGTRVEDTLREKIAANYGLALFPEASVQGGRLVTPNFDEYDGDIVKYVADQVVYQAGKTGLVDAPVYGMQKFNGAMLSKMIDIVEEEGNPFIVPIAIDGINRLVRPTNKRSNLPTMKGLAAVAVGSDLMAVTLRVGMPQTVEELRAELRGMGITPHRQNLADHVARIISGMLPEDRRGFYRQEVVA